MPTDVGKTNLSLIEPILFRSPQRADVKIGELEVRQGEDLVGHIVLKPEGYRYYHGPRNVLSPSRPLPTLDEIKKFVRTKHLPQITKPSNQ